MNSSRTGKLPATMRQQWRRKWLLKAWLQAWAKETSAKLPQTFRERVNKSRKENSQTINYMKLSERGLLGKRPCFKEILRDSREERRNVEKQWTCKASWNYESIQQQKSQVINKTFRKTFLSNLQRTFRDAGDMLKTKVANAILS